MSAKSIIKAPMRAMKLNAAAAVCAAFAMVALAPGLAAAGLWLSEAEIASALEGQTLAGMYASGKRFSERYMDGGALEYTEDGRTIRGHWSITSGTLCTIYDTDPTGGCFRAMKSGAHCLEFYFVSRSEETAPGPPGSTPHWTARGTTEGSPDACQDGANV